MRPHTERADKSSKPLHLAFRFEKALNHPKEEPLPMWGDPILELPSLIPVATQFPIVSRSKLPC
jgi:hypothetical protein